MNQSKMKNIINEIKNIPEGINSRVQDAEEWKQILTEMKGEIDNNVIVIGDFNTPLTLMDRS